MGFAAEKSCKSWVSMKSIKYEICDEVVNMTRLRIELEKLKVGMKN